MKKMSAYVKNIILTHPVLSIIILLVIPIFVYLIALVIVDWSQYLRQILRDIQNRVYLPQLK